MDHDQEKLVDDFANLTNLPKALAQRILEENEWDLPQAMDQFYGAAEEPYSSTDDRDEETSAISDLHQRMRSAATAQPLGRRLGTESDSTASATTAQASSSSTKSGTRNQPKKKFASLKDLQDDSHSHDHDEDSDKDQEYFAGGDKSGLAVQEPGSGHNQHIQRLLDRARRNGPPPPKEDTKRSAFSGQGQTLGGDDVPSEIIPDPEAGRRPAEMVERTLHVWDDGFSIDDGPLHRYDDPANRRTLEMINRGSAPLDLMNVQPGQAVDVRLATHRGENYSVPQKSTKPFSSGGQRLGSPVPGAPSSAYAPPPSSASAPIGTSSTPTVEVNESEPTLTLQLRLADGTRLPSRFNTTHTIGDVYSFVERSSSGGIQRPYTLATTFPTKELTDKSQVLGDMAEFKRGGVIVQKWT